MQLLKNKILLVKELALRLYHKAKGEKVGEEGLPPILDKPKKSIEYSNLVRRMLLFIFTAQWTMLLLTSERMYLKNGDIGANWTKLLIAIVGMMSVILGFYFSGQYSDRNSEEFKKLKEYDNDRFDEYKEEVKEFAEDTSVTPKAVLDEDKEDDE